uniref:Uncharacterized protein n=1 Tax=Anguilla anguilla TaxID=7936 RepID=A0A0E9VES2_ANGAN
MLTPEEGTLNIFKCMHIIQISHSVHLPLERCQLLA